MHDNDAITTRSRHDYDADSYNDNDNNQVISLISEPWYFTALHPLEREASPLEKFMPPPLTKSKGGGGGWAPP